MSLHTCRHQGPCKPGTCATFTLNPYWGRAAAGKKKKKRKKENLASMHAGLLQFCPTLCEPVDCGLPRLSVWGFFGKNTGVY